MVLSGVNAIVENPAQDIDQPYDTIVKAFFRSEMDTLVSHFLKGATLEGTLEEAEQNVEIDRSMLKIDLAYWIKYLLLRAILHIELQSGPDNTMARRLLVYFACLHLKYNLPVFCIVIFLFKCAVKESPYEVSCGDKVILPAFHYDVIRLWEEDAQPIFDERNVPLYVLLPAMKGPTLDMLCQAIREIRKYYGSERCYERLFQFHVILSRTTTVPDEIKDMIGKELFMSTQYAEFVKLHPYIRQELENRKEELLAEGEIKYAHKSILKILHTNCPDILNELVELPKLLGCIKNVEVLEKIEDAALASDRQSIQTLIETHAPTE
jgi:hypothetical protein